MFLNKITDCITRKVGFGLVEGAIYIKFTREKGLKNFEKKF